MAIKLQQMFVNLPVKDLERSMEFFTQVGFEFNPMFTNEQAAALVLGDNLFAMLLVPDFFKGFTSKPIPDASMAEAIVALSADSREQVDEIVNKALAAGGKRYVEPVDHGFMYEWGFEDPDGHLWSFVYMDPSAMAQ